jgi:Lysyl oxidase
MSGLAERRVRQCVVAMASVSSLLLLPAPAGAVSETLPDLRPLVPRSFTIQTTQTGQRQLRFTTLIANIGAGAFQVTGARPSTSATEMTVSQQIFNDQGGVSRSLSTPATMFFAGDGHNHWHLRDLETYELVSIDNPGGGTRTGEKHGFCFWDNTKYNLSLPNAPQNPVYTNCGTSSSLQVVAGLSVGWADKYAYKLPNQFIDITNLPSGQYRLVYTVDQQGYFTESRERNNVSCTDLRIDTASVTILGRGCP